MSHCFHVWYAHPLPWDAESGQEHWEQTRNSGVHEPRLVGCVERLNALLQAHDADMVWAEEPEVSEPCAVLALVPQAGSMNFVADAIAAAAREQGLCVLNPFDGSVWLPNGRVLRRMALAVVDPSEATPRAPAASAVDAATTTQTAEQDSVAQALRGDAPLAAYLLARWAPLLRQAGFKVRSRPSSEHPWCVFTGKVLRVHVHGTVRHSKLTVSVVLSPGGKAMPACLQTEFGVGSEWVDLVALARWGALPVAPAVHHVGVARDEFSTELAHTGGDPARLADLWLDLFRVLVQWLEPLDDVQTLAQAVQDPASPFVRSAKHPVEGLVLSSYVPEAMALLAGQPGAALAAYRSLALTAGNGLGMGPNRLQGLLPPFPQTPHPVHPHVATGVEELLVWQGSPDAAAPLDALAQLRQTSCVPVPAVLQWWLDVVLSLCPLPEPTVRHPDVGAMPGPWAEFPDTTVRQPWLHLVYGLNDDGKLRGATYEQQTVLPRLRARALQMGLTVYSPQHRCVWTPDDRLHTPFGVTPLKPLQPPPLQPGAPVSAAQAFYAVHDALAPLMQRHGFRTGQGAALFCKANAQGTWTVFAPLSQLGDEGLLFRFEPYRPRSLKLPSRHFSAKGAAALLAQWSDPTRPEPPPAVQLVGTSPERLHRAIARVQTLLVDSVLDVLHWLEDPAHCTAWVESTAR